MTMLIVEQVPFGGWRHHLARWEACHWILRHRAGYLSEGAFMGRLGANVSGLAYSYAEYAPYGSLRIQFPCHPRRSRGHYGCWAAAAMEIMTVTVITVCAADRQHIYSSPKAIPHPLNLLNPLNLHAQRACPCLPADWYLSPIVSNAACTEILRLRLRMTVPGGQSRNADFKLIARRRRYHNPQRPKAAVKL